MNLNKKVPALFLVPALLLTACGSASSGTEEASLSGNAAEGTDLSEIQVISDETYDVDAETSGITDSDLEALLNYVDSDVSATDSAESIEIDLETDDAPVSDQDVTAGHYSEFVTLGTYRGLSVKPLPEGTKIENGMTVTMDYITTINGVEIEGISEEGLQIQVGSGGTGLDGFEEQMIGHVANEEFDVTITFPEDTIGEYTDVNGNTGSIAGATAVYQVTVTSIFRETAEEALQDLTGSGSQVISYPANVIAFATQYYQDVMTAEASVTGMDYEEYMSLYGPGDDQLEELIKAEAKSILVCEAILDAEGITEDSAEYEEGLQDYLDSQGYASVKQAESEEYGETDVTLKENAEYGAALRVIEKYGGNS